MSEFFHGGKSGDIPSSGAIVYAETHRKIESVFAEATCRSISKNRPNRVNYLLDLPFIS